MRTGDREVCRIVDGWTRAVAERMEWRAGLDYRPFREARATFLEHAAVIDRMADAYQDPLSAQSQRTFIEFGASGFFFDGSPNCPMDGDIMSIANGMLVLGDPGKLAILRPADSLAGIGDVAQQLAALPNHLRAVAR